MMDEPKPTGRPPLEPRIKELENEVHQLKARNQAVENRLGQVETWLRRLDVGATNSSPGGNAPVPME
jgi:hypothetical protein